MEPVNDQEFMCRCSPEAAARCDEVIAEAKRLLVEEWGKVEHEDYWWYGAASLGRISMMADQWSWVGIEIDVWDGTKHTGERISAGFQCDLVRDGLAACIVWAKQEEGNDQAKTT